MPVAGLSLSTTASPTRELRFADAFARIEDALTTRASSRSSATTIRRPRDAMVAGGGRISSLIRYMNMIDIFENATCRSRTR